MKSIHRAVAVAVAACVWGSACTPDVLPASSKPREGASYSEPVDELPASSKPSEISSYAESFDVLPQGFPRVAKGPVTGGVADGAYIVTFTEPEKAYRIHVPVSQLSDQGLVRLETDVEVKPQDGPMYGVGCWAPSEGKGGYLGLVQVTRGRAAAAIAYEDSAGVWEPLQRADEGPTVHVAGVHTIRMDCTRRSTGGTITLSVNNEQVAAVDVAEPPDTHGLILFSHYGGTPLGTTATVRFDEVRVNPPESTEQG